MARGWMPFYVADYLADTLHLDTCEHGAYLLLILHYWQHGGLPGEDAKLQRITRLSESEWARCKPVLADLFDDGWAHGRVEKELADAKEAHERRRSAGAKGGKAKAMSSQGVSNADPPDKHCSSNARAMLCQSQSQPQLEKPEAKASVKKAAAKRGTSIPEDWQPTPELIAFAISEGLTESEVSRETDRFRNHFLAKSTVKDGRKSDWPATYRNWITSPHGLAAKKRDRGLAGRSNAPGNGQGNGLVGAYFRGELERRNTDPLSG